MQSDFFVFHMKRLEDKFPGQFPKKRVAAIYRHMRGMSGIWFRDLVDRVIAADNPNISFKEEAAAERLRNVKPLAAFHKSSRESHPDPGVRSYQNALNQLGSTSMVEAFEKLVKEKKGSL